MLTVTTKFAVDVTHCQLGTRLAPPWYL